MKKFRFKGKKKGFRVAGAGHPPVSKHHLIQDRIDAHGGELEAQEFGDGRLIRPAMRCV
jgi:hypothetical protein